MYYSRVKEPPQVPAVGRVLVRCFYCSKRENRRCKGGCQREREAEQRRGRQKQAPRRARSQGVQKCTWMLNLLRDRGLSGQSAAAAHLTHNLDAAFHLVEVRISKSHEVRISKRLQPLFSGEVPRGTRIVDACRSEIGEKKRENACRFGAEFSKTWKAGGSAKTAVNMFLGRVRNSVSENFIIHREWFPDSNKTDGSSSKSLTVQFSIRIK
ncbi:hypothetical protein B0H13DRAFT_1867410 [Mycena leptocephala]|nr:hypothetical protein B0H13DRAFT_1867410 [Mycena leptocephala]